METYISRIISAFSCKFWVLILQLGQSMNKSIIWMQGTPGAEGWAVRGLRADLVSVPRLHLFPAFPFRLSLPQPLWCCRLQCTCNFMLLSYKRQRSDTKKTAKFGACRVRQVYIPYFMIWDHWCVVLKQLKTFKPILLMCKSWNKNSIHSR